MTARVSRGPAGAVRRAPGSLRGDPRWARPETASCSRPSAPRFSRRLVNTHPIVDVPVQYYQSVITIELAIAGALLWQIRFFEPRSTLRHEGEEGEHLPHPGLRLLLALVLGATVFGSLWAIAHEGQEAAATAVTIGVAVSLLPILLRVLPPLATDAATHERDPNHAVTLVGLLLYVAVVGGIIVLLNV